RVRRARQAVDHGHDYLRESMDHEYDQHHKHSPAAATTYNDSVEPGQSSRSHLLRKSEQPIASGLVQRKANDASGRGTHGHDAPSIHQIAHGEMSSSHDVRAT